jgi:hypothetical protein
MQYEILTRDVWSIMEVTFITALVLSRHEYITLRTDKNRITSIVSMLIIYWLFNVAVNSSDHISSSERMIRIMHNELAMIEKEAVLA